MDLTPLFLPTVLLSEEVPLLHQVFHKFLLVLLSALLWDIGQLLDKIVDIACPFLVLYVQDLVKALQVILIQERRIRVIYYRFLFHFLW